MECKSCHRGTDLVSFEKTRSGFRKECCYCRRQKKGVSRERVNFLKRRQRRENRITHLMRDCRASDKKKFGVGNDLTREFVEIIIKNGCKYCGETEVLMTLDRIDNKYPHTMSNVNASCLRCNYVRGSMPFEAWAFLVPFVRKAREAGLFGSWRSNPMARIDEDSKVM
jgi:hypothetical protein